MSRALSILTLHAFALAVVLSTVAQDAHAAGEADVFARLLSRVSATEQSTTVARYLLQSSPELRTLSREILGKEAANLAENRLTETAIRRLQRNGDAQLARALEERLIAAEEDFIFRMRANPLADVDTVMAKVSTDRFKAQDFVAGKPVAFREAPALSEAELALRDALKIDPELAGLKNAVREAAVRSPQLGLAPALDSYDALLKAQPALEAFLPRGPVYTQLADEEMIEFTARLQRVITELAQAPVAQAQAVMNPEQRVRQSFRTLLEGNVPARQVNERIEALVAASRPGALGQAQAFRRALGEMTLPETRELLFGLDPLNPSAESLLGQYLKETGATTSVRSFTDHAGGGQGPQRLVVSLSAESTPAFLKFFQRKEWMSVINHAWMVHDGQVITHGQAVSPFRAPNSDFNPYPVVVLTPSEGQRMSQYLKLFTRDRMGVVPGDYWYNHASAPWNLQGYCARSAWGGCTQHMGNIPIGDTRVIEYTVPGDQAGGPGLVQRLKPYASNDALIKRVWKVPGNQQFAEMLGQQKANLRGEFANPGWLIWTLMGPASAERVPVVFLSRVNHREPIPAVFEPGIEGRR